MSPIMRFVLAFALVATAPFAGSAPAFADEAPATSLSDAELAQLLAPLASPDPDARRRAAKEVSELGPPAVPAIERKLEALRRAPSVAAAVKASRARRAQDLSDALVEDGGDEPGHRAAVTTTALLRALARIGTTPALRLLVRAAIDHDGAFRDEVGRHVAALGDKAVPALLATRKQPAALRSWAYAQLESMGKRIPSDAVQTTDNQVLADVLHVYGEIQDIDALPVLLAFVNADRLHVRAAAREAVLTFDQGAATKLREAYANVTGKPAPEWPAPEIAKALFAAYDHLRLQEVHALVDEGLAKEKEGKIDEAIAAFDKVLARQPMIDRRVEMVGAYVAHARSLEASNPGRALAVFRKAARLWPDGPRAAQIEAEIAYLEGKDLLARGIADVEPFERALALDATHDRARTELARLAAKEEEGDARFRIVAGVSSAVLVAAVGLVLFGGRRRSARA